MTPHDKQVMMFSATLSPEIRPICKKFMNDVRIRDDVARVECCRKYASVECCSKYASACCGAAGVQLLLSPGWVACPT